ncbi:spike base protein, RCAP_Rcc01079 family [Sphingomonas hankookensis]|uniref:spike base protein, RCAP_Rcc01079 family n=1 Tax=Sphingomonas hankookensis TaxID=563996 RepID=UPI003D3032A1
MPDPFQGQYDELSAPSNAPFAVVPHDSNELPIVPKGIYVGTGGDVTLRGVRGVADVTYKNLPDASYIAVRARYVRATGTTASNLIGEA